MGKWLPVTESFLEPIGVFYMKCLLSWVVYLCYLESDKLPDIQKKSEKSTNAWWENLPLQVLHSFRKGETVFYSTCEQRLMQESLCFLMPSSKCCITLFSSVFLFRGVKMLVLYHYCEVAFSAKQGWKKVLKLKQSFCCWKFIFKTWKQEKNLMLWFLTDIQILISGTSIFETLKHE